MTGPAGGPSAQRQAPSALALSSARQPRFPSRSAYYPQLLAYKALKATTTGRGDLRQSRKTGTMDVATCVGELFLA
jgi:hypothetical protein